MPFGPASGGGLAVDVRDEGNGLPRAEVAKLFNRTDVPPNGHGIGLSLAATLVRAEGGRLYLLEAEAPPTFRILLPEAEET